MYFLIPLCSAALYRWDGMDNGLNYARHGIGIPIWLITGDWRYIISYFIAGFFVYGDKSIFSKLLTRKGSRILHSIAFGLASLDPYFSIWTTIVFFMLFEIAEHGIIDNKWSELLRGGLGTIRFLWI